MELLFATSNAHKVEEANAAASEYGVRFQQINVVYPEVRAESVRAVAEDGVRYVHDKIRRPVVVEDSGLFIGALDGFPGAYSAYVYRKIGCAGILRLLEGVVDRSSEFRSAVGYHDDRGTMVFEGVVGGYITPEERGVGGFGYDPIFKPRDSPRTFAEDPEHKKRVSHRRKAIVDLCRYLGHA